jgi:DNA-directed RNA polymerase III subunit RPC4
MGIMRIDRKEEKKALATSAELAAQEQAQEEDIFIGGDVDAFQGKPKRDTDDKDVWHAAPEVPVDGKPGKDNIPDVQPVDFDAHDKKLPAPLPEFMEIDSKSVSPAEATTPDEAVPKKKPLDPEVDAITRDLKTLLSELGPSEEGGQQRDGRLYLFQFPPVLPPLKPIDGTAKPEKSGDEDDVKMAGAGNADDAMDLTGPSTGGGVKTEPLDEKVTISDMAQQLSEGGLMGKLNVRRSGKVELDWGGRILELAPATHLNFLTKAVLVEQGDEKPKPGDYGGEAFDMGKVMGRFVLAPVWGDEEDWVVDEEDLEYE